jgi:hypothetical protein
MLQLGNGWKQLLSLIFPYDDSWFPQPPALEHYQENWVTERMIPKGLEFGFKVHKMNSGRKVQQLLQVHFSLCSNKTSVQFWNDNKFLTFK